MKLITVVTARTAMQKLVAQDLPLPSAWQVMKLIDACNVHLDFYGQQLDKLGTEIDSERLRDLDGLDVGELAAERIRVPLLESIQLSAADLKALEPFAEFYEIQN